LAQECAPAQATWPTQFHPVCLSRLPPGTFQPILNGFPMDVPEFECDDLGALRPHVEDFVRGMGLDLYGLAARMRAPGPDSGKALHLLSNAGTHWEQALEEVSEQGLPHNSVRHAVLHLPPVAWSVAGHIVGHTVLDEFALEQIRRVRQWGLRAGMLIPVYAPELEWGFMAFYSRSDLDYATLRRLLPACSLYASNFAFWYLQLTVRRQERRRNVLTGREADSLRHAALGLTSAEIGEQLGIGARTVESYIATACAKLKARGRREAILIASDLQLISGRNALTEEFERQRDEFGSRPLPRKVAPP
jgi:DNA-binding CsgD family transcriptional regulator